VIGSFNYWLVVLSLVFAIGASFVALNLAVHIQTVYSRFSSYWLIGGGISMGLGIWSMHFVGMLAFHLPIPVAYDITLTLLSLVFAIVASILALATISKGLSSGKYLYLSTFLMGTGVAAMHYTGMEALDIFPAIQYRLSLVIISLIIAYTASFAALKLSFMMSEEANTFFSMRRLYASLVMGVGIAAMHYTGMFAAIFQAGAVCRALPDGIDVGVMSILIVLGVIIILLSTFLLLIFDIKLGEKDHQLLETLATHNKELTSYMQAIDEHAIVSVADSAGRIIQVNEKFCEISGYKREELLGQDHHIVNSGFHTKKFFIDLWTTISSGKKWHGEICNSGKNGVLYWVDSAIVPVLGSDGKIDRYVSVRINITERRRQAQEINQAYLELAEANKQLQHLSRVDGLTQIANRRCFDESFLIEVNKQSHAVAPITLILCDIDCFKNYNDTYGHVAGDVCLQRVAQSINSCFTRADDVVARYGGEEFAVILTGIDIEVAFTLADRMRENVEKLKLEHSASTVVKVVTISVGVTSLIPNKDTSVSTIIEQADKALYMAKEKGRNNVQYFV